MEENWKDVKGYEGMYQVSDLGRVKSLSRIVFNHGVNPFTSKEKILKQGISTTGKLMVSLRKDNKSKSFEVHQIEAIAFLNHTVNGHKIVVDHIDNNPFNNKLNNLQLITQRENASKDVRKGSSKYVGVSWVKSIGKWYASIQIKGKTKNLGYFDCELQASNAYQTKLKSLA